MTPAAQTPPGGTPPGRTPGGRTPGGGTPGVTAVTVRGGSAGITANAADLRHLARLYAAAGLACAEHAVALHADLVHPAVLASAVLDPVGAVRFAQALVFALDGPAGLTRLAAHCAATDVALRVGAQAYVTADQLHAQVEPAVAGFTGIGTAIGAFDNGLHSGGISGAVLKAAAANPQLADTAVDVLSDFWSDTALIAAVAALPDGRADVHRIGVDTAPQESRAPRCVRDLLTGLAWRNRPSTGGDIDVRFVYAKDASGRQSRRAIVDIPGTKNWQLSPHESDPTSSQTNLRAVTGARTTYQQGVLEAMRQAGVGRDEPVLLVGHSQGGMVAVNVATQVVATGEFAVTNVVTAGSPVARLPVPDSVEVLSIENDGDVVPHAEGADNPDRINHTTVTAHHNSGDAVANHDLTRSYVPAAADVDASADPSVRNSVRGLQPFLTGGQASTVVFHVRRR